MNQGYTEYSGFTLEDALESDFAIMKEGHPSEAAYRHFCATVAAGAVWQGALQCPTKDGRLIWERVTVSPAVNGKGEISHLLCIRENLTSQREVEEKLARTEQLLVEETRAYTGSELSEEAQLTLKGVAHWMEQASGKPASKHPLARLARISHEVLRATPQADCSNPSDSSSTSLHLVFREALNSLSLTLPAGRRISYRGSSEIRVLGGNWNWMQVITLAARNFLIGHEERIGLRVRTRFSRIAKSGRSGHGTLLLRMTRTSSAGKPAASKPSDREPSDADLAFIAGVVQQAGGRVVSGLQKPWIDPLVLEVPAESHHLSRAKN